MKIDYKHYEEDKKISAEMDEHLKRDIGARDIESMLGDEDKFDRRKFGKISCSFCKHDFNPFYVKTLIKKEWKFVWRACEYREPEADCEVGCPKCKEKLYFRIYIGQ